MEGVRGWWREVRGGGKGEGVRKMNGKVRATRVQSLTTPTS